MAQPRGIQEVFNITGSIPSNLEEINNQDYDLVIMGAHGHGTLGGTVVGNVSRRVLRRSKTPVLVVRLPEK